MSKLAWIWAWGTLSLVLGTCQFLADHMEPNTAADKRIIRALEALDG